MRPHLSTGAQGNCVINTELSYAHPRITSNVTVPGRYPWYMRAPDKEYV